MPNDNIIVFNTDTISLDDVWYKVSETDRVSSFIRFNSELDNYDMIDVIDGCKQMTSIMSRDMAEKTFINSIVLPYNSMIN